MLQRLSAAASACRAWCRRAPQCGWLCFALAFSPALVTGWLIAAHAVNVPVWDGWERGVLLAKASAGELDLAYLASAHIDHRPLFPRLITLAANAVSGGDVRLEMWIGFAAVFAGSLGLLSVLRKTLPAPGWSWPAMFALNLLIFSPLHYQNFLWAVQLAFLLPLGCLGLLLAVMRTGWGPWGKGLAAGALALIATFSFGHGLLLWPVAVCMALMDPTVAKARGRWLLAGGLAAASVLVVAVYFNVGYTNTSQPWHAYGAQPGEPPPGADRLGNLREEPVRVWAYFWTTLGNPVSRQLGSDPLRAAPAAGRGLLVLFSIGLLAMFGARRRGGHWRALLPWAACGAFALFAAALMASGRGAGLPVERALLPRYLSLTTYLPVCLVAMSAYALYCFRGRGGGAAALVLFGLFAGAQWQSYTYGAHKMSAWQTARLQERFQLLYLKHKSPRFPSSIDGGMTGLPDGEKPFAVHQAEFANAQGWLRPAMFDRFDFGTFTKRTERARSKAADLTRAQLRSDGLLQLSGYATLPGGRIADGVLVAWAPADDGDAATPEIEKDRSKERAHAGRIADTEWRLLDIVGIQAAPAMRASSLDGQFGASRMNVSKIENYARFDDPIDTSALPDNRAVEITLWVADCQRMEVAPLKRTFLLDKGKATPGAILVGGE